MVKLSESQWGGDESIRKTENRKEVVIAAACSHGDLGYLIPITARALASVSSSTTFLNILRTTEGSQPLGGSKTISITASCHPNNLGKLMQIIRML